MSAGRTAQRRANRADSHLQLDGAMARNRRNVVSVIVLALLIIVLGGVLFARLAPRGPHAPLAGVPPPHTFALQSAYRSEEAWIVSEVAHDIVEMASYPAPKPRFTIDDEGGGLYRISFGSADVRVDLRDDVWAPDRFAPVARAVRERVARNATPPLSQDPIVAHAALLNVSAPPLVDLSLQISHALAANMSSRSLHESAALTVGAFALREPRRSRFFDVRWAMNRMTAHLALAAACGCGEPSADGRLAQAVLLIFENRQTLALELLERLASTERSRAVEAWSRAMRLRVTRDVRHLDPTRLMTPLEKREYFDAVYGYGAVAQSRLSDLGVQPSVTFVRSIVARGALVEEGWAVDAALAMERAEYQDVFRRMHGKGIDQDPSAVLNERATRCVERGRPEVLPWGAWAEFAQRQLALTAVQQPRHYMRTIGATSYAENQRLETNREFERLSLFPLSAVVRYKPSGEDVDASYFDRAAAIAMRTPERVSPNMWQFLEDESHCPEVRAQFPRPRVWFMPPSSRVLHNAGPRVLRLGFKVPVEVLGTMRAQAPYDVDLARREAAARYGEKRTSLSNLRVMYGPLLEYNVDAVIDALRYVDDEDDRVRLERTACDLDLSQCMQVAWRLQRRDRAYEAAALYERVFADPQIDAIAASNASWWLVSYYYSHRRIDAALALATRSADTGSSGGLTTLAYLYERLGRFDEAEALYRRDFERYGYPAQLFGFYYRAVNVRQQRELAPRYEAHLRRVFPAGLQRVGTTVEKPSQGVVVVTDNRNVRVQGLRAGDIITGLEGYQVNDLREYRAINACFKTSAMKLTIWRGGTVDVTVVVPDRFMDVAFHTYPKALPDEQ
jgi:hypothetical protein